MSIFGRGGYGTGRGFGGGGGGKTRWIIGAVIALIGIITYFAKTEINPVTGEKQRIGMTVEQEKALGLDAAPEMAQQMGGIVDWKSDPDAELVARVGHKLVKESDARKSPYGDNFNFYLLNDRNTVNAFALPGGQIFITRALFDRLENEAQLAGVLGHEIGHVVGRHSAAQMAKSQLGAALVTGVAVGASGEDGAGRYAGAVAAAANQMAQLRYGREDESQGDSLGLRYMAQADYDPSEMLNVMRILKEAAGGGRGQPEWLSSHPLPDTRIADIEQYLAQTYPNGVPGELTDGQPLPGASGLARERRGPDR
jgi:beta-barrel assembly-enhancing protease